MLGGTRMNSITVAAPAVNPCSIAGHWVGDRGDFHARSPPDPYESRVEPIDVVNIAGEKLCKHRGNLAPAIIFPYKRLLYPYN